MYYIFLAVTILFTYILRDSQHPKAREDLQHLSMAATFFTTLIPGDGPCNYAKFMTKMCANFERVARAVVEREQKTFKSSDRHPQPVTPSVTTQGQNERSSPSKEQASHSSCTGNVDIPQIEGLPRINSSGYVVPESPSAASEDAPSGDLPAVSDPLLGGFSVSQPHESTSASIQQSYQYPMDDTFPAPMAHNIQQPELWQIPMTADWEFGGQFLSLFGPQFLDQGGSDVMSAMAGMTAPPMPSAPMNMGFNCEDSDNVDDYPAWMPRGFMNLF